MVGALLWAAPDLRGELLDLIGPGDLEDPASAAGLEDLRRLHRRGVHEAYELVREFVELVHARRKAPRQPGDPLPPRFPGGPETWISTCYREAAGLGGFVGAFSLALTVSGWGRRREIAHRAAELHAVALDRQYNLDDVQVAAEKLIEAVGRQ